MIVEKIVKRQEDLNIVGITLLSVEEYENAIDNIQAISKYWWLRSPGLDSNLAAVVLGDGLVNDLGAHVYVPFGVRPALRIQNLEKSNMKVKDKFEFAGETWTVISNTHALCDRAIKTMPFKGGYLEDDANDYEKSDVKAWLDGWFFGATKELKGEV